MTAPQRPCPDKPSPDSNNNEKSKPRYSPPPSRNGGDDGRERIEGGLGAAVSATLQFYLAVAYFLRGGDFESCPYFEGSPHAKAQVYSLATTLWMWDRPHYRAGTYQVGISINISCHNLHIF